MNYMLIGAYGKNNRQKRAFGSLRQGNFQSQKELY